MKAMTYSGNGVVETYIEFSIYYFKAEISGLKVCRDQMLTIFILMIRYKYAKQEASSS